VQRIRQAVSDAYYNAPSLGNEPGNMSVVPQKSQDWLNRNLGPIGGWIANEPGKILGTGMGIAAAVPAAIGSTLNELGEQAGVPAPLRRDLTMGASAIPADQIVTGGLSGARTMAPPSTRLPAAEPPIVPPSIPGPVIPGSRGPSVIQPIGPEALDTAAARGRVRGLLGDTAPGPTSPTGIAAPMAPPEGYAGTPKPTSSAPAFATSDQLYKLADKNAAAAGDFPPSVPEGYLASIKAQIPSGPWASATGGTDAITDLYNRALDAQGKPMSGADALATDQRLTQMIHDETDPQKGISDVGRRLQIVQDQFRAATDTPEQVQARLAWQQAEKMKTIEDINEKAEQTQNPTAAIKTAVKNLTTDAKASAGWSPEELAAVRNWGDRGTAGDVMYTLGSRLTPAISRAALVGGGSLAGYLTGDWAGSLLGMGAGTAVTEAGSAFARDLGNAMSQQRMQQALEVLGKTTPNAPPRPPSPFVATTPGAVTAPPTGMGSIPAASIQEALKRLGVAQAPGQQAPTQ
jgi:hypothetical protein